MVTPTTRPDRSLRVLFPSTCRFRPLKMKTKQIDQLTRARTGLRGWMTRDFDAGNNIIESHSPEIERVEEKLDSIVTRLQKAEDLQVELAKLFNNNDESTG